MAKADTQATIAVAITYADGTTQTATRTTYGAGALARMVHDYRDAAAHLAHMDGIDRVVVSVDVDRVRTTTDIYKR